MQGYTRRVVVSIVDEYRKATYNFRRLQKHDVTVETRLDQERLAGLMSALAQVAAACGMEVFSCAETIDLQPYGIRPGKCIDDQYLKQVFGITVSGVKDKNQRPACGCVASKDIGIYDTCLHGCAYCYAGTIAAARKNHLQHDPDSPSLLGYYDVWPQEKQLSFLP